MPQQTHDVAASRRIVGIDPTASAPQNRYGSASGVAAGVRFVEGRTGLIQICYTSRATAPLDRRHYDALVTEAQERNHDDMITGLLLYDGARFVQALEGPEERTNACMARIERDRRHEAIDVVSRGTIAERQFGTFAMAALMPDDRDNAAFVHTIKSFVENVEPAHVKALFIGFAVLSRARGSARASNAA